MIIFYNNKNRKRINSAKGIKPMAFFICKNLFKYIKVVCSGNNGGNRYNI